MLGAIPRTTFVSIQRYEWCPLHGGIRPDNESTCDRWDSSVRDLEVLDLDGCPTQTLYVREEH